MKQLTLAKRSLEIQNRDVKQSYIITTARYSYTVYEKRILYRIIEMLHMHEAGIKFDQGVIVRDVKDDIIGGKIFIAPISYFILNGEVARHGMLIESLETLKRKEFRYQDKFIWQSFNLISDIQINKIRDDNNRVYVSFRLHPRICEVLLNFSKGFVNMNLKTAIALKSVCSTRLYELLSGQKRLLIFTIDNLKYMFMVEKAYKNMNNFIKNVILPAKRELDASAPYSFTYTTEKTGRKITSLTFNPVYHPENRDTKLEAKSLQQRVDLSWTLDQECQQYLIQTYKFTISELKRNSDLWKDAKGKFNLLPLLKLIERNALSVPNPKGYVINSIKETIKQSKYAALESTSTSPSIQRQIKDLSEKLTKR